MKEFITKIYCLFKLLKKKKINKKGEDYAFQWTCHVCNRPSGSKRKIGCVCENMS